jgi:predicted RNA-binding Zn-ribbon protein involved in translation (DUF1610 family)
MALIIHPDRSVEVLTGAGADGRPTLEQLQTAVGGLIELIRLSFVDAYLVVDEEGLFKDLPPNLAATEMVRLRVADPSFVALLTGPAVLCARSEIEDPVEDDSGARRMTYIECPSCGSQRLLLVVPNHEVLDRIARGFTEIVKLTCSDCGAGLNRGAHCRQADELRAGRAE